MPDTDVLDLVLHRAPDLVARFSPGGDLWLESYEAGSRIRGSGFLVALAEACDGRRTVAEVLEELGVPSSDWPRALGIIEKLHAQGLITDADWRSLYFQSFTFQTHHRMLRDTVRVEAYRDALAARVRPGDVVVDVGTGTGILAMLAARAGAARVWAIEAGPVIGLAERLIAENGLSETVRLVRGEAEHVELPEPADLLVSETMGTWLLQEGGLSAVASARDRLLKPGGVILPEAMEMLLAPVELAREHDLWLGCWTGELPDRYGLTFATLKEASLATAYGAAVPADAPLAPAARLTRIEAATATVQSAVFEAEARFDIARDGALHGFCGHFTAELAPGITLSNRPGTTSSWPQQLFPFEAVPVRAGDELTAAVGVGISAATTRRLAVRIEWRLARGGEVVGEGRGLFPET